MSLSAGFESPMALATNWWDNVSRNTSFSLGDPALGSSCTREILLVHRVGASIAKPVVMVAKMQSESRTVTQRVIIHNSPAPTSK